MVTKPKRSLRARRASRIQRLALLTVSSASMKRPLSFLDFA